MVPEMIEVTGNAVDAFPVNFVYDGRVYYRSFFYDCGKRYIRFVDCGGQEFQPEKREEVRDAQ